ncbi:MAG: bacterial Ig-like domain-containing protein, partial [Spirochaetaceae bacterium]|nr:bacterial Ig-like domain-containing protein [Spirochaetaceae bacterium]
MNKRSVKGGGGLTKTKKTALIAALCVIFLTQCEVWNKPLIEELEKTSSDEDVQPQIERLIIESPPWPNTFNIGDDPKWEELGLRVSAVYTSGEWRQLNASDYDVTGFDSTAAAPRQPIKILPKNGNENAKAAIFYITILSDELDYYSIEPYI